MLKFFDANCMYGKRAAVREGSFTTHEEYEELFDRAGIDKVLIYHTDAVRADLEVGNMAALKVQNENERYVAQWVVMPSLTGEFYTCDELVSKMKENGIKSVRMFPKALSFPFTPYGCDDLFRAFEKHRIPLFIDLVQTSHPELYAVLKEYPDMPVVVCGQGYNMDHHTFALANACKNFYVETSTFVSNNSIETFVNKFGAERLIFGSGVPNSSACGSRFNVQYACISEEDKQKIASGNLERLLGEVLL